MQTLLVNNSFQVKVKDMNQSLVAFANSCTASRSGPIIGSRILDREAFLEAASRAIIACLGSDNPRRFDGCTALCPEALPFVTSGVGLRSDDPEAYVVRAGPQGVEMYLKRLYESPSHRCLLRVNAREHYFAYQPAANPLHAEERRLLLDNPAIRYLITEVEAAPGMILPTSFKEVTYALAQCDPFFLNPSLLQQLSKASIAYWKKWCVVAD